ESGQCGFEMASSSLKMLIIPEYPLYSAIIKLPSYKKVINYLNEPSNEKNISALNCANKKSKNDVQVNILNTELNFFPATSTVMQTSAQLPQFIYIKQGEAGTILLNNDLDIHKVLCADEIKEGIVLLIQGVSGISIVHLTPAVKTAAVIQEFRNIGELKKWQIVYNSNYHLTPNAPSIRAQCTGIFKDLTAAEKKKLNAEAIKTNSGYFTIDRNGNIKTDQELTQLPHDLSHLHGAACS
ncbi:MAG: hypothetical protein ACK4PR_01755, partial [Gammaproteobacteria bacterium]